MSSRGVEEPIDERPGAAVRAAVHSAFVGDIHQRCTRAITMTGGNLEKVKAVPALAKTAGSSSGNLHGFWIPSSCPAGSKTPATVAKKLITKITLRSVPSGLRARPLPGRTNHSVSRR